MGVTKCMVLSWVIEEFKKQNKENPCAVCGYATEQCLQELASGIVPLTGDKFTPVSTQPYTSSDSSLRPKKKKRKRRRKR